MSKREDIVIRPGRLTDVGQIQAIYAHYVLTSPATFEEKPPDLYEMSRRFLTLSEAGFPYLVAARREDDGVLGYAYASPYRPRVGYRHTVEDSIYLARHALGRGIGTRLLRQLVEDCTSLGKRQMIAVIGVSDSEASIRLHLALGFRMIGTLEAIGLKFGRWVDTAYMQRALGKGASNLPEE